MEKDKSRICFVLTLKENQQEEYKKRHSDVGIEMKETLKKAGVENYSIWLFESNIIGYFETQDVDYTQKYKKNSEIFKEWNKFMAEILNTTVEGNLNIIYPECVFLLE